MTTQTNTLPTQTTQWVSREIEILRGALRGFLARRFPSVREAASQLGKSHHYLNSLLSGRTQLKLPALLRILRLGGSGLRELDAETDDHPRSHPLRVLRHHSQHWDTRPDWFEHWNELLLHPAPSLVQRGKPFDPANLETAVWDHPREAMHRLDEIIGATSKIYDRIPRTEPSGHRTGLIRLALLRVRASYRNSTIADDVEVLETVLRVIDTEPRLSWLRPEALLATAQCISSLVPSAVPAVIPAVVHSSVVQENFAALVGALLLDAETALHNGDAGRADTILRSLVRHLQTRAESDALSDSRVFPRREAPAMQWLSESPTHFARVLLASAWRHWLLKDYSEARSEIDAWIGSSAETADLPHYFQAQAAWLEASIARDTGLLPQMEQHLARAAQLDRTHRPIRAALAHQRRLLYLWQTGQHARFEEVLHQDLATLSNHLPVRQAHEVFRHRTLFSRGRLAEEDLRNLESELSHLAASNPGIQTPW